MPNSSSSGIRDNRPARGTVASFLQEKIQPESELSFVSAFFTIYAYGTLSKELQQAGNLRFLFGEPRFLQALDLEKKQRKTFRIENDQLELAVDLPQIIVPSPPS